MRKFKNILQKNYKKGVFNFAENLKAIEKIFLKFIKLGRKLAEN